MSEEENKTGIEEVKVEEVKEEKVETNEDGKKFVEFSPEQEARFKRVYGNLKEYERSNIKLAQQNGELFKRLEELETRYHTKDTGDRLSVLKSEKKSAYEAGDIDKVMEIDDQIMELRSKPAEKKEHKENYEAVADEWLTPERKAVLNTWAGEQDKDGNPVRPWADQKHPKYKRLIEMAAGVMSDPDFTDQPLEKTLEEVDKLMGLEKPKAVRTGSAVLSGDGNVSKKTDGKLTPDQERTARFMFPNEKDPIKKYREATKKWGVTA